METYHPKTSGSENALKALRERVSDHLKSVARIALPFVVETYIMRCFVLV